MKAIDDHPYKPSKMAELAKFYEEHSHVNDPKRAL